MPPLTEEQEYVEETLKSKEHLFACTIIKENNWENGCELLNTTPDKLHGILWKSYLILIRVSNILLLRIANKFYTSIALATTNLSSKIEFIAGNKMFYVKKNSKQSKLKQVY